MPSTDYEKVKTAIMSIEKSDYDKNKVGIRYMIKKIIPETKMIYKVKCVKNNNIHFESKPQTNV